MKRCALLWLASCTPADVLVTDEPVAPSDTDRETPDDQDSAPSDPPPTAPAGTGRVDLGPPRSCEDPAARTTLGPLQPPEQTFDLVDLPFDPARLTLFEGGGISVADLDDDGLLDLIVPDADGILLYLQVAPRQFLAWPVVPTEGLDRATAVTPGDADGDGDLDLFVARYRRPDVLLTRGVDGLFVDTTELAGVAGGPDDKTAAGAWADYDRDGDLDLVVAVHGGLQGAGSEPSQPSHLWRNRGDGSFEDASDLLPSEVQEGYVFVAGWHDLDEDGWLDLYTVHDFGNRYPNALLWNRQGTLVPDDGTSGLDLRIQGMGLGVGDLDGDGLVDLVVAGWNNNRAMVRRDGVWFDVHASVGLDGDRARDQVVGWATELGDLDNDGDLDVVEGFGHIWNQRSPPLEPDEVFLNEGERFVPVGSAWGFDHEGQTRGVLAVDVDGDGWLDLVRNDLVGPATLQFARCGDASWVEIALRQEGANARAIGARLTVEAGGKRYLRDVTAGGISVLSAAPARVHVGLGAASAVDAVEVRWPDGVLERYEDLPARRLITVHRKAP